MENEVDIPIVNEQVEEEHVHNDNEFDVNDLVSYIF
jgi:hypothetical protein